MHIQSKNYADPQILRINPSGLKLGLRSIKKIIDLKVSDYEDVKN